MSEPAGRPADDRHLPLPDQDTTAFWQAAAERHFVVRHCTVCDWSYHYPRRRCPRCGGEETTWIEHDGLGTVISYTVVHQAGSRTFAARVPYVLAVVDLGDGVRLMTNVEADPGSVSIGMPVRIGWRVDGDVVLPIVVPRETT
jgi:uncharacterized OB-fold protein